MASNGPAIVLDDFSGGLNTFDPEYLMPLNQSPDLDNVIILNRGFKKRNGDAVHNSSAMVGASTAVTGLGYIKFNSGVEFLNAVAGTKFFTDSSLSGTMADATGSITITAAQNNLWTPVIYNNLQIWFGGAPNAPFKYSGSGNAAALGGSPPSAATAFVANNRVFAISTAASPSILQWSILGDPEDWTGTGSGSSTVGKSDGEALQCGIVMGPDTAILFKNTSTHMAVLTRAPFPVYQLQKGIGICGRYAWAQADGTIYFISSGMRLKSTTDGVTFQDYPTNADLILDSIPTNRIPYVQGFYLEAEELVVFVFSTDANTTNNYMLAWDLAHKCFIRCTTGFKANVLARVRNRTLYAGHYNGKIYRKFVADDYSDASETSGAINGYWRTPYKNTKNEMDSVIHPFSLHVAALSETSGTLDIFYGFDFSGQSNGQSFSIADIGSLWDAAVWDTDVWGGQMAKVLSQFIVGRGNFFSFNIRNNTDAQGFTVQGAQVRLRKVGARKMFTGV